MWREATSGWNDQVHQRPTLGPGEPRGDTAPAWWGETEKAFERRKFLSMLALLTLVFAGTSGGGPELPVCLLRSHHLLPPKVTLHCWLFPFTSHMLSTEFSIILHVLKFYGHSILLLILFPVTLCSWDAALLLCIALVRSFSPLYSIPVYEYTVISYYQNMDHSS